MNTTEDQKIKELLAKYAKSIDEASTTLAAEVWSQSSEVSFIHPRGNEHGWEEIKNFWVQAMGETFSERKIDIFDVTINVYDRTAVAVFNWHFAATFRKDGSPWEAYGRETDVFCKNDQNEWAMVHGHYSRKPE